MAENLFSFLDASRLQAGIYKYHFPILLLYYFPLCQVAPNWPPVHCNKGGLLSYKHSYQMDFCDIVSKLFTKRPGRGGGGVCSIIWASTKFAKEVLNESF